MSVKITKLIDKYIIGSACLALAPFSLRKRLKFERIDRILIIKLWAVGESVLTLPMIKILREKFPKAQIDVMAMGRNKDIYKACRYIDNVIGIKPIFKKYELVFDCEPWMNASAVIGLFAGKNRIGFSHGLRSLLYNARIKFNDKQHEVLTFLDLSKKIGAWYEPEKLERPSVSREDMKRVNSFWKQKGLGNNVIGIAPGVAESAKSRMWSLNRYAEVIEYVVNKMDKKIILIGTEADRNVLNALANMLEKKTKKNVVLAAGKLTQSQSFGLIGKCKLFISNDTGPMHIAAAMGVKTIGLFGPNTPVRFAPFGQGNISIYHKKACSPCINVHEGQIGECRQGIKCLSDISVGEVLKAVEELS